jgi:hypothetical protein
MKKIVLVSVLFAQILFAQPGDLSVNLIKISPSDINWEMTLTLNAPAGTQSGFLIEIPSTIKMVPLSVRINQTDLWLQNSDQVATSDSVVNWVFMPDGVSFLFREGQLTPGDPMVIKAMITKLKKRESSESVIKIRSLQNIESAGQISNEVITSADISSIFPR